MNFLNEVKKLTKTKREEGDYIKKDLLYCGKCNTPKQTKLDAPIFDNISIVPVNCLCKTKKNKQEELKNIEIQKKMKVEKLRDIGITDKRFLKYTFENCFDINNQNIKLALKYVNNFKKMKKENIGLMIYGNVGAGKTFIAGCIANKLISEEWNVYFSSISQIINIINDFNVDFDFIKKCDLLIIDDFGVSRKTDYVYEQLFKLIDLRYNAKKPLIITTNLPPDVFFKSRTIENSRIYDRISELCIPIEIKGDSVRKEISKEKLNKFKNIMEGN